MATFDLPARRLILAGSFAAAIAVSPAIAVFVHPTPTGTPVAACPSGETEDPYTFACVPELTPTGGGAPTSGAPSEQQLTQCSGRDQSNCVEQDEYGNAGASVPKVDETVHQSP
jgi:hypothetical protein